MDINPQIIKRKRLHSLENVNANIDKEAVA